ncbi:isochorismatase [Xylariaceae sp. FL0594]|nr:isochorismatase [Xylariaceae sp. FL0594]
MTSERTISLGPEGDSWVYDRETRVYDLTRGGDGARYSFETITPSESRKRGETEEDKRESSIAISPSHTALVVVDMQNFFLHPRCNDYPAGLAAAERVREVVARCRDLGIRVIWLNWGLTSQDLVTMPAAVQRSFSKNLLDLPPTPKSQEEGSQSRHGFGSDMGHGRGRLLMEGSWNAEIYSGLQSCISFSNDVLCSKNRISGLWADDTPLARALKGKKNKDGNKKKTLLFAGVNTDQCVLGTLFDAYNRGYDCVMLEDCCATKTPGGKEVTVWNVARGYGFVTDSARFCHGELE